MRTVFDKERLTRLDYVFGGVFLSIFFVLFYHDDIYLIVSSSLNYIFGSALEFYDNCKKMHGVLDTPYPPTIYVLIVLWSYPLKLLGFVTDPNTFSPVLIYWVKILGGLAYVASGYFFYQISTAVFNNKAFAKFAAFAWATTPIALFSTFIFTQIDVYYVLLTLIGVYMFFQERSYSAAVLFGLAITIKYFPVFVFIPLLLLYRKSLLAIVAHCCVMAAPTILERLVYKNSPAFVDGVLNFFLIDRIFAAKLSIGFDVYYLVASFFVLCAFAFFSEPDKNRKPFVASYIWLASSILPFLFVYWHPQWLMFVTPAIVLTTMISSERDKFLLLDLLGMVLFVAAVSSIFPKNGDTALFRNGFFGVKLHFNYLLSDFFNIKFVHRNSLSMYASLFWGYLVAQIVLKYSMICGLSTGVLDLSVDYNKIRRNFYVGLLIFLVPVLFVIYKDLEISRQTQKRSSELRLEDLKIINMALAKYALKNESYPIGRGPEGNYTPDGRFIDNWIGGLVPEYVDKLPRDPRRSDKRDEQYFYWSDGKDFKLISHAAEDCDYVQSHHPELVDPQRKSKDSCWAYGYWTPDAAKW